MKGKRKEYHHQVVLRVEVVLIVVQVPLVLKEIIAIRSNLADVIAVVQAHIHTKAERDTRGIIKVIAGKEHSADLGHGHHPEKNTTPDDENN